MPDGRQHPRLCHHGVRQLVDGLTCDPKDRRVLAAAVRADAAAIVTFNVHNFRAWSVEAFEIEVIDPDTFLLDQPDPRRSPCHQ